MRRKGSRGRHAAGAPCCPPRQPPPSHSTCSGPGGPAATGASAGARQHAGGPAAPSCCCLAGFFILSPRSDLLGQPCPATAPRGEREVPGRARAAGTYQPRAKGERDLLWGEAAGMLMKGKLCCGESRTSGTVRLCRRREEFIG